MTDRVIYETTGRAREYSQVAANLFIGCDHGCKYCWSPQVQHMDAETFANPVLRSGVMSRFERDAEAMRRSGDTRKVLMSFTTDPYNHVEQKTLVTRDAIKTLHVKGIGVTILTKGGKRSERDFDLLAEHPELSEYATTLTCHIEEQRQFWEPGAAPTHERVAALEKAHELGIRTWVSLEPVLDPAWALYLIQETSEFVDHYKVGTINYHPLKQQINWKDFGEKVVYTLKSLGKDFYLKKDLLAEMRV